MQSLTQELGASGTDGAPPARRTLKDRDGCTHEPCSYLVSKSVLSEADTSGQPYVQVESHPSRTHLRSDRTTLGGASKPRVATFLQQTVLGHTEKLPTQLSSSVEAAVHFHLRETLSY